MKCKNCGDEIHQHNGLWFHWGMVRECSFIAEPADEVE